MTKEQITRLAALEDKSMVGGLTPTELNEMRELHRLGEKTTPALPATAPAAPAPIDATTVGEIIHRALIERDAQVYKRIDELVDVVKVMRGAMETKVEHINSRLAIIEENAAEQVRLSPPA